MKLYGDNLNLLVQGREALFAILEVTLTKICEFLKSLAAADNSSRAAAELLKVICKIIWALTFSIVPKGLAEKSNFNTLMESLLLLVNKEVPMVCSATINRIGEYPCESCMILVISLIMIWVPMWQ